MHFSDPFSSPGRWWKGNLHTHTTQSDGGLAPEQAADLYRKAGYHFLALTDHGRVTDIGRGSDGFLLLLGAEMDGDRSEVAGSVHVVGFGLAELFDQPYEFVPAAIGQDVEDFLKVLGDAFLSGDGLADAVAAKLPPAVAHLP